MKNEYNANKSGFTFSRNPKTKQVETKTFLGSITAIDGIKIMVAITASLIILNKVL